MGLRELLGDGGADLIAAHRERAVVKLRATDNELPRTPDEVIAILEEAALPSHTVKVERAGVIENPAGAEAACRRVRDGWMLVAYGIEKWHPAAARLVDEVAADTGGPVTANLYYAEGREPGYAPHSDYADSLVIQTAGCKEWQLFGQGEIQIASKRVANVEDFENPPTSVILEAGDSLFVPAGLWHQPRPLGHSIHVNLKLNAPSPTGLLRWLADDLESDPAWHAPKPLADFTESLMRVRGEPEIARFTELLAGLETLVHERDGIGRYLEFLAQGDAVVAVPSYDGKVLRCPSGIRYRVELEGEQLRIFGNGQSVTVYAGIAPVLGLLAEGPITLDRAYDASLLQAAQTKIALDILRGNGLITFADETAHDAGPHEVRRH